MKKYYPLLLVILLVPSMAYAAWWNPLTWNWNPLSWLTTSVSQSNIESPRSALGIPTSTIAVTSTSTTPTSSAGAGLPHKKTPPPSLQSVSGEIGHNSASPSTTTPPPQNVQVPTTNQQTPNVVAPINTCNGTLCNGVCYNACPVGQDFICPADGGHAYCQYSQQQQQAILAAQKAQAIANLESALQSWQNQLTPVSNQITSAQNQFNQACLNLPPIEFQQGVGAIQTQQTLMNCNTLSQSILMLEQEAAPIQQQISIIQQKISTIQSMP